MEGALPLAPLAKSSLSSRGDGAQFGAGNAGCKIACKNSVTSAHQGLHGSQPRSFLYTPSQSRISEGHPVSSQSGGFSLLCWAVSHSPHQTPCLRHDANSTEANTAAPRDSVPVSCSVTLFTKLQQQQQQQ